MKVYRFEFNAEVTNLADFQVWLSRASEKMGAETKISLPVYIEGETVSLGVESMGHGGGYWYEFEPLLSDGGVLIAGKIRKEIRAESLALWEKLLFGFGTVVFLLPMGFFSLIRAIGRRRRLHRFLADFVGCTAVKMKKTRRGS